VKRFLLLVIVAAVASGAAAPSAQRGGTVARGVTIGGLGVGGLNSEQARSAITWWYNRPLHFVFYGKQWSVKPSTLGSHVDADEAVREALKATPRQHIALRVDVDETQLRRYVRALDGRLSIDAEDATATLKGLRPVVQAGKPGLELNRQRTLRRLQSALAVVRRPVLRPAAKTVAPEVTRTTFGAVVVIYRGSNELHLYRGEKPWRTIGVATGQAIYPTPLGTWHVVDMQPNPGGARPTPTGRRA